MPRKTNTNKKKSGQPKGPASTPSKRAIKSSLMNFLRTNESEPFNYKQVAARLGLHSHLERDILLTAIEELLSDGLIEEEEDNVGRYRSLAQQRQAEGRVDMTKSGGAYIVVEGLEEDIYVAPGKTGQAFHGDIVRVELYAQRKSKRPEGEVIEVLERNKTQFTGVLKVHEKFSFLISDSKKVTVDIFVPISKIGDAKDGDKVVVQMIDWPKDAKSPIGKVVRVLGRPGDHNTEMNAIMAEFDLPVDFPDDVKAEADAIPVEISEAEADKRWDFRGTATFTIDPIDAKDFDDALSVRDLGKGLWEVGIHIADVAHYLQVGTILDQEALNRATSVYLVDRVIPMLPENLSNVLCSLRPNEDKLTFSVVVVLNEEAHVVREWYGRTVIHSDKRFTYEEAQEVLETGEGPFAHELLALNMLAYKLRERKFAEGAISFETEEVKFKLDENGKPLYVYKKERKDAHKLIEDFMLLANRKVAEYIFKRNNELHDRPFVYRVHDNPSTDKVDAFARIAAQFGHKVNTASARAISESLNKLMINVEGRPEQNMLQTLAIRTMPKAFYTTKKASHYGLAFDFYTHFTSPIRRYPDVIAHRLLAHYLENKKGPSQDDIESQAKYSSDREVRAAEAERASIKYKQVEYMRDHIGDEFEGVISGVTDWGIYVEILENKCEGMVRIAAMRDDYYTYEEERYLIRGNNTGKVYQLGDIVRVRVLEANLANRTIDFEFAEAEGAYIPTEGGQPIAEIARSRRQPEQREEKSRSQRRRESRKRKKREAAETELAQMPAPIERPEPKAKTNARKAKQAEAAAPAPVLPEPEAVAPVKRGRGSKAVAAELPAPEIAPADIPAPAQAKPQKKTAVRGTKKAEPIAKQKAIPVAQPVKKGAGRKKAESPALPAPEIAPAEIPQPAAPVKTRGKKKAEEPQAENAPAPAKPARGQKTAAAPETEAKPKPATTGRGRKKKAE